MTLRKKAFENVKGKKENAGKEHFLFFPVSFNFLFTPDLSSANLLLSVWIALKSCF